MKIFSGKIFGGLALLIVGGIGGAAVHAHFRPTTVHAQDAYAKEQFSTFSGCINIVPKEWGVFRGSSGYGLAFEDKDGTLRFVQRPVCGSIASSNKIPTALIDLQLRRE